MPTAPTIYYPNTPILPYYGKGRSQGIKLPPSVTYQRGQILAEQYGVNAQQSVTLGAATGGTFTLTFGSLTTAPIVWNATLFQVRAALNALAGVAANSFAVTGNAGGPWTITFAGALGSQPQSLLTGSAAGLTPGGSTIAIANVTTGVIGSPGTFWAFDDTQSDGRQVARAILAYDASVDALGNITWSPSGTLMVDWNFSLSYVPAWFAGAFLCAELVGLTDAAIASNKDWSLINGTISSGILAAISIE